MKRVLMLAGIALLSATLAHANIAVSPNETFTFTGTGMTLSPCCVTNTFAGLFTVGSSVGSIWSVTAFGSDPTQLGCNGAVCPTLPWNFSSLKFDASTGTLFGNASVHYTGGGGDSRLITILLTDGSFSGSFTNVDLTLHPDTSNDRSGTFSYRVNAVPEPSSIWLLTSAFGVFGAAWRKARRSVRG